MHVKEQLVPHPTGKSARDRIFAELEALEADGGLGVQFIMIEKGDRICECRLGWADGSDLASKRCNNVGPADIVLLATMQSSNHLAAFSGHISARRLVPLTPFH